VTTEGGQLSKWLDKSWTAWLSCASAFIVLYVLLELLGALSGCTVYRGIVAGIYFTLLVLGSIWIYYFKSIPLDKKICKSGIALLFAIATWHAVLPSFSLKVPPLQNEDSEEISSDTLVNVLNRAGFEIHPPDLGWPESVLLIVIATGITLLALDFNKFHRAS
jgi:hypothetical protein